MKRRVQQLERRLKAYADMRKELWLDMESRMRQATSDFTEQQRMTSRIDQLTRLVKEVEVTCRGHRAAQN